MTLVGGRFSFAPDPGHGTFSRAKVSQMPQDRNTDEPVRLSESIRQWLGTLPDEARDGFLAGWKAAEDAEATE